MSRCSHDTSSNPAGGALDGGESGARCHKAHVSMQPRYIIKPSWWSTRWGRIGRPVPQSPCLDAATIHHQTQLVEHSMGENRAPGATKPMSRCSHDTSSNPAGGALDGGE